MPRYDYQCPACRHVEEAIRLIEQRHDAPQCGECGHLMELRVAPVAFSLKGWKTPKFHA